MTAELADLRCNEDSALWVEGGAIQVVTRKVELPEDDAASFALYLFWLYSGKIATKQVDGLENWDALAGLYIIGEKLVDKAMQDRVIDTFVLATRQERHGEAGKGLRWFPTKENVDLLYKSLPGSSPARQLMVDMHVLYGAEKWIDRDDLDNNNKEFLADLAVALLARATGASREKEMCEIDDGVPCSYHHHGKDEPCDSK
ncbi:hypothetical protein LTR85_006193 [Meristemomyces frigidus]|nr:hypothetical protein LTR85_006193 [Meristemomyces frigidus]